MNWMFFEWDRKDSKHFTFRIPDEMENYEEKLERALNSLYNYANYLRII